MLWQTVSHSAYNAWFIVCAVSEILSRFRYFKVKEPLDLFGAGILKEEKFEAFAG